MRSRRIMTAAQNLTGAATALLISLSAGQVLASGVGASRYVPGKARQPVERVSYQATTQGEVSNCGSCQRLGFACVDHATPPPCTAEGGCYPNRPTFGFTKTKWRRWPGADYGGPTPTAAGPGEGIPAVDEPAAEDEDMQAPQPIDDSPVARQEGAEETGPPTFDEPTFDEPNQDEPGGFEVPGGSGGFNPSEPFNPGQQFNNSQPFEPSQPGSAPEQPTPGGLQPPGLQRPEMQRPGGFPGAEPQQENGPPSLPFGFDDDQPATEGEGDWNAPPTPFNTTPATLKKPTNSDGPPPLPFGFTSTGTEQQPRRLPTIAPANRYDERVQQASAELPIR